MGFRNEYVLKVKELLIDINSSKIFEVFYNLLNEGGFEYSEVLDLFSEKKDNIVFNGNGFTLALLYPDFATNTSRNLYLYVNQSNNKIESFKVTADFKFANMEDVMQIKYAEIKYDFDYRSEKSKIVFVQKNQFIKSIYAFVNSIIEEKNGSFYYVESNEKLPDENIFNDVVFYF